MTPDQKYHAGYSQISGIHPGSPGERAGFKIADVILAVNGVDARTPKALFFAPQQRYVVRIRRGTEERERILVPTIPTK
jgi:S1-C subfamily serine protease